MTSSIQDFPRSAFRAQTEQSRSAFVLLHCPVSCPASSGSNRACFPEHLPTSSCLDCPLLLQLPEPSSFTTCTITTPHCAWLPGSPLGGGGPPGRSVDLLLLLCPSLRGLLATLDSHHHLVRLFFKKRGKHGLSVHRVNSSSLSPQLFLRRASSP